MRRWRRNFSFAAMASVTLMLSLPQASRAQILAIDFDTDGDPSTVQSTVEAEVGTLVYAYLVLNSTPHDLPVLIAEEFGLGLSDGLAFRALAAMVPEAMYIQNGTDAIAVAHGRHPVPPEELPVFIMRFVLQVTAPGRQEVTVEPAVWPTHANDGFVWVLTHRDRSGQETRESLVAITTQRRGEVNPADPLPVEESTWSRVKSFFREEVAP